MREVVGCGATGLLAGGEGVGEMTTVLGAAGASVAVTGQMVVYTAMVEVTVRAGQSLTEAAHSVTVYTVVE